MLGSVQGAFKVPTVHLSGFGFIHDSFACLLIPLTRILRTCSSDSIPFKELLGGDYTVVVGTLRGSTMRAPS